MAGFKITEDPDGIKRLWKWDKHYNKWNMCGALIDDNKLKPTYISHKKEILYLHHSLGVSATILQHLISLNPNYEIRFVLGTGEPFDIYTTTAKILKNSGIKQETTNDQEELSYHLPLSNLFCVIKQTRGIDERELERRGGNFQPNTHLPLDLFGGKQ